MSLADVNIQLAEVVMPAVCAAVMPDTMFIMRDEVISDGAGGQIKRKSDETHGEPIPCVVEPLNKVRKVESGGQVRSITQYSITFPVVQNSERLDIQQGDRLRVEPSGLQPEYTYQILNILDSGVIFEAVCERE